MKNFVVFKLVPEDEEGALSPLFSDEELLDEKDFTPCSAQQINSLGFVETPFGSKRELMSGGVEVVQIRTQKKSPNKAEVNHIAKRKADDHEKEFGNRPPRVLVKEFKQEAYEEVLLKTFPDEPVDILVYYKVVDGLLFVEVNSYKKGFEVLGFLTPFIKEYSAEYINVPEIIANKYSEFVKGDKDLTEPFVFGNSVKLVDTEGRKVAISNGSIYDSEEAINIIKKGGVVEELELDYDGVATFKVKSTLEFSGLKFSKDFGEESEGDSIGLLWLKAQEVFLLYKKFYLGLGLS